MPGNVRFGFLAFATLICIGGAAADSASSYIIQTVAGSDNTGDGGLALSAVLAQPEGIAIDSAGNVYVADAAANRVRKIALDGTIHTIAGTGTAGFSGDGGPATAAALNQPYGLAFDHFGNLYIADLGNARVRKISGDGAIQTVAGGGALPATNGAQGGPATSAQLNEPRNVAMDGNGNLYISDFGANQVYGVSTNGSLTLVAGNGAAGFAGDGGNALQAELNAPAGLAVDGMGALYIADSGNSRVRRVYHGAVITVFNTPSPTGLAFDSKGNLYVAAASYFGTVSAPIPGIASAIDVAADSAGDLFATSGSLVLEISSNGAAKAIAGSGAGQHFGGDNGPAASAQLSGPSSVVMDAGGNWNIADTTNNRIRMINSAGVIKTVPTGSTALSAPRGLAMDTAGNLFIADSGNNAIREITPAGAVLTVGGGFKNPVAVAADAQGSIYIADSGNDRVVKVSSSGTSATYAQIKQPLAVAVDANGNVFVADASQIWKVNSAGVASTVLTGLHSPSGITLASDGSLLIADTGASEILQWSPAGSLDVIAGTGAAGFSGDGGPALAAQLNGPAGVGIGPKGSLWIADTGNNRVRSLAPTAIAEETAPPITVVNAASLAAGPIAPGEIVTIFGSGFDPAHTQLLFDGAPATLFYSGATQINALAPAGLRANASTMMSIVVNGATMASSTVPVNNAAPGIFTATSSGTGQAAANNQDGSLNSASNPAPRGTIISLWATGEGATTGATVSIGGYPAQVPYAGPAPGFPGLMQINVQIPGGFLQPGILPVTVSVGGAASQAGVTVAIQ